MRIGITGVSGFLGSHLMDHLKQLDDCEVVALSHSQQVEGTVYWDAGMPSDTCAALLQGCDVLIHGAAYIPADHSDASEAGRCISVNAIGTLNLLNACKVAGIEKMVFISGANIFAPVDGKIRENSPISCVHAPYYLGSKVLAEVYVRAAASRGLNASIIRPSAIYGKGMRPGVIQSIAQRLIRDEVVTLKNNGDYRADFVHVDDCVSAIGYLALSKFRGEVNIGSGVATNLRDLAAAIASVLGKDLDSIKVEPGDGAPAGGFGAVDLERIKSLMEYRPASIREGLRKTLSE